MATMNIAMPVTVMRIPWSRVWMAATKVRARMVAALATSFLRLKQRSHKAPEAKLHVKFTHKASNGRARTNGAWEVTRT